MAPSILSPPHLGIDQLAVASFAVRAATQLVVFGAQQHVVEVIEFLADVFAADTADKARRVPVALFDSHHGQALLAHINVALAAGLQ